MPKRALRGSVFASGDCAPGGAGYHGGQLPGRQLLTALLTPGGPLASTTAPEPTGSKPWRSL